MNPLDDTPAECPRCGDQLTQECGRYDGRCEPFAIIVVGEQFAPHPGTPEWDEPVRCCRTHDGWHLFIPGDALMDGTDAWGLPLVWDGEPVIPNADRLVRLAEATERNGDHHSHVPIRNYDAYDLPWFAIQWARTLGGRVVMTGRDGGQEVTP
jgi:hypothetical protein